MRAFPESTCTECGRKMPAGEVQKCTQTTGGFCSWHIPLAASEIASELLVAAQKVDLEFYLEPGLTIQQDTALGDLRAAIAKATGGAQ